MNKPFRNLAIAAITIELLLSGPRVCAQTNSWQQDMEIISAARAAAAASPVPVSEQYIPTLNSNTPPPGLLGNYFSLQLNTPPLPYPQWGLPTYLIDAANAVYLVDDTAVNYADLMPPLGGIMPYSFNLAGFYTPTPFPPVCGTGGPAYITNFNATLETNNTTTVSFVIAGGISNELYDIFFASNILSPTTVWQWLAHGEPCDTYEFTNQPAIQGYYKLARMATNNSTGTDFWLAYMYLTTSGYDQLSLYISSPFATTGIVTIPLLGTTNSFTLAAGEVTNIPIDTRVIIGGSDGYGDDDDTNQTNGIHVTSSQPVSVYAFDYNQYLSTAFTCYPTPFLGTNYCLMARDGNSEFALVATADATTVIITPSATANLDGGGNSYLGYSTAPITNLMQRGQTFELASYSGGDDVTGTWIVSDKPVAVFAGAVETDVPDQYTYAANPLLQEQLPVESWGPQVLTVGFAGRTNGDSYRVLAAYDDTTVSITGTVVGYDDSGYTPTFTFTNETVTFTTNSGGFFDVILEGPAVFQATQPIQVAHLANGEAFDQPANFYGDPAEILLPPTGQFLKTNVVFTPGYSPGFPENFLNLVVAQSAITNTSLDGTNLAATNFIAISSTGYYGTQISVSNGVHKIISSQPVGVEVYGFGVDDAYGYFGGVVK